MKPLDDAKFSGTKDVDERLKIDSANLQPWIDEYVPNTGKIKAIEFCDRLAGEFIKKNKIYFSKYPTLGNLLYYNVEKLKK